MANLWLSPPMVMLAAMALVYGLYRLSGKLAAHGEEAPGKHEPYACGEELLPTWNQLSYHTYFRLALMFGILHVAALVLSMVPAVFASYRTALAYVLGVAISVLVLAGRTE